MHYTKAPMSGRLLLIAAIAVAVVVAGVLPLFSGTGYATGTGLDLNGVVALSRFSFPGVPTTRTTADVSAVQAAPFALAVGTTTPFPASGQLLVSGPLANAALVAGDGAAPGAEIMTYDQNAGTCGAGFTPATQFCITQRGPAKIGGSAAKAHPATSKVKLATVLTAPLGTPSAGGANGAQATLTATVEVTAGGCLRDSTNSADNGFNISTPGIGGCPGTPPGSAIIPFTINIADGSNFPAAGSISLSHEQVQTSNQFRSGNQTELMTYDNNSPPSQCSTATAPSGGNLPAGPVTLCIKKRAQESTGTAYQHLATGFGQPGQSTASPPAAATLGVSTVDLLFQLPVKSNAGFFPSGDLLVCNATNPLSTCELIGYNQVTPLKTPSGLEFYATGRGGETNGAIGKDTTIAAHGTGSIVTGADQQQVCRMRFSRPGGFTEPGGQNPAGSSVGVSTVCYMETQPNDPPMLGGVLNQPLVGTPLIIQNLLSSSPFLSTGGFTGLAGTVPFVDSDGNNDSSLDLATACINNITPGVNLQVRVHIDFTKSYTLPATGTAAVTTDTRQEGPSHVDDCDDPPSSDLFTATPYIYPGSDPALADTDRDGCTDDKELGSSPGTGGLRDPWNPFDFYDTNHDGAVTVNDILLVASAFSNNALAPTYHIAKDRGSFTYGPFPQTNLAGPNGSITVGNDILVIAGQYSSPCLHAAAHAANQYNGTSWPGGPAPWYGVHPTALTAALTNAAAPFNMAVTLTASFAASGTLLIDGETFTYNQAGPGCVGNATNFCITGRAAPVAHPNGAVVFRKP